MTTFWKVFHQKAHLLVWKKNQILFFFGENIPQDSHWDTCNEVLTSLPKNFRQRPKKVLFQVLKSVKTYIFVKKDFFSKKKAWKQRMHFRKAVEKFFTNFEKSSTQIREVLKNDFFFLKEVVSSKMIPQTGITKFWTSCQKMIAKSLKNSRSKSRKKWKTWFISKKRFLSKVFSRQLKCSFDNSTKRYFLITAVPQKIPLDT